MSINLFKDHASIITGAGQGIGFEICSQLALQGASVLLNDVDEMLTASAVETIKKEGGKIIGMHGDAGDVSFIQQMVKEAANEFGKLTIVIANAGITLFADFFEYTPESFYKVMQLNLGGRPHTTSIIRISLCDNHAAHGATTRRGTLSRSYSSGGPGVSSSMCIASMRRPWPPGTPPSRRRSRP